MLHWPSKSTHFPFAGAISIKASIISATIFGSLKPLEIATEQAEKYLTNFEEGILTGAGQTVHERASLLLFAAS